MLILRRSWAEEKLESRRKNKSDMYRDGYFKALLFVVKITIYIIVLL